MPGIHSEVLEVRAESRTLEEFEGRLLEKYELSKRSFMEWVESPGKGRNASVLLRFGFDRRDQRLDRRSCAGGIDEGDKGPPDRANQLVTDDRRQEAGACGATRSATFERTAAISRRR